jgi:hypothetical protein
MEDNREDYPKGFLWHLITAILVAASTLAESL